MKKSIKGLAGVAVGAGVGYLAMGELIYQAVLNIDIQNLIIKSGIFKKEDEERFWAESEIYNDGIKWFEALNLEDVSIPSRLGRDTFANIIPAEKPSNKWAVVIHGFTASPAIMSHYAWKYHSMGFNVVMPHMIAHGKDEARYSSMGYYDKDIILDWIAYINNNYHATEILMHGVSMGSATTLLVTGENIPANVVCAIADCGYTSCWDEYVSQIKAMFHMPSFPFVYAANTVSKLRKNFDFKKCAPIEAVMRSKTPTLFVHGEDDGFVPYSMMKPLYERCAAPDKQMLSMPGAFHANSAFVDNELYWNTVCEFIGKYFKNESSEISA